jgi:hypothetical protein
MISCRSSASILEAAVLKSTIRTSSWTTNTGEGIASSTILWKSSLSAGSVFRAIHVPPSPLKVDLCLCILEKFQVAGLIHEGEDISFMSMLDQVDGCRILSDLPEV